MLRFMSRGRVPKLAHAHDAGELWKAFLPVPATGTHRVQDLTVPLIPGDMCAGSIDRIWPVACGARQRGCGG